MIVHVKPFNEQYFSVHFPDGFNDKMLNAVRTIPGRKWSNEKKLWLIPNTESANDALLKNLYEIDDFNIQTDTHSQHIFLKTATICERFRSF